MTTRRFATLWLAFSMGFAAFEAHAVEVRTNPGIRVQSDDGVFAAYVGGRILMDGALYDNDDIGPGNVPGIQARQMRIEVGGSAYGWNFTTEMEFADNVPELMLGFVSTQIGQAEFRIGHILPYMTLDARNSSLQVTFTERALLTSMLWPIYRWGMAYTGYTDKTFYHASVYNLDNDDSKTTDGWGAITRLGFDPVYSDRSSLHFGGGFALEQYGFSNAIDEETGEHEAQGLRLRLLPAGRIATDSRVTMIDINNGRRLDAYKFALETSGSRGRWSYQAEYGRGIYDDGVEEGELSGYYGYVSYFLTDDTRPYDHKLGRYVRVRPRGSHGAFEIAARYQHAHGEQGPVSGALTRDIDIDAVSGVINWYRNPFVRFTLDITHARTEDAVAQARLDATTTATFRVQLDY